MAISFLLPPSLHFCLPEEGQEKAARWGFERPAERETESGQSPDLASHAPAVGFPCCSTLSRAMPASMSGALNQVLYRQVAKSAREPGSSGDAIIAALRCQVKQIC